MDLTFTASEEAFAAEVRSWLAEHVEHPGPFGSVDDEVDWGRSWQATLAAARMVAISWPHSVGGRDASPVEVALYNMEYARSGAPQPINRVGISHVGPTLLSQGTVQQQQRWMPAILDASELWCQLFSEPDAGSDLAALRARAEPTDGGWLVSGQKVWTSYARHATWGIALVRTDPDAPRHSGISCMAIAMDAPGVDVRPLRQITGESEFNEVFLDEVFVPEDQLIGGLHQGWAVANTTLVHERGVGFPFKEQVVHEVYLEDLVALASRSGRLGEPAVDDALVDVLVLVRILRLYNWRTLSRLARGIEPGPESSLVKLAWTEMTQRLSTAALAVLGDQAPLWPTPGGELAAGTWQRQWLWSKAAGIAGGTTEVQRTIVAERLLSLPRAPADQGA